MPDGEPSTTFSANTRRDMLHDVANAYVETAIANAVLEYPHMPWIVATGPDDYRNHKASHPAFYGAFDWHSCVEMHWVAIRLMRRFPRLPAEDHARQVLGTLLTPENIAQEAAFFAQPEHRSFERPYGWGWLLTLWEELAGWDDPDGRYWATTLAPLASVIVDRFADWLPKMTYPQRVGMHANTAFGLSLAWDAMARQRPEVLDLVRDRALAWFSEDSDYPARFEPSGADFLSPALTEAELMSRVLDSDAFPAWLDAFLPGLATAEPASLFTPAIVSDPTDGQIAHLHGLNLSRAWGFVRLAQALPDDDPRIPAMLAAAERHAEASLAAVTGSDYMVEHWLAAYATLLLSEGWSIRA